MEKLDQEIGEKLKKLREKKSLSMREVAKRIDIDHSYIGKIEKGKIPSLNTLRKLCDIYGVTISSLFGDEVIVPVELKEIGVEWISFAEEMENKELTPDEIKAVLEAFKTIKKL
jgi:transcriptional regulator with XRE-family HTH domain